VGHRLTHRDFLLPGYSGLKFVVICIILLCLSGQVNGQSVNYTLDSWIYDFLERLEAKDLFTSLELRSKPISRGTVQDILKRIRKKIHDDPTVLTAADKQLLRQLEDDLYQQNKSLTIEPVLRESIIADHGPQAGRTSPISETTIGFNLYGSLGKNFAYHLDIRNAVLRGGTGDSWSFDIASPSPTRLLGPNIFRDRIIGYFVVGIKVSMNNPGYASSSGATKSDGDPDIWEISPCRLISPQRRWCD